ncbi:hypothetical protein CPB85DRAFT_469781 [Mucidula mucida]|nr:hypothetical protein CPB85DRAFT_469781 [Mucidula mucida]
MAARVNRVSWLYPIFYARYTPSNSLYHTMSIESTFGTVYVGFVLGVICYGFTFFQTSVYFSRFPKDAATIKFTVISLCAIDTGSSALLSHAAHHYFVRMFSSGEALTEVTRSLCVCKVALFGSFHQPTGPV